MKINLNHFTFSCLFYLYLESQFLGSIEGINTKTLSIRLKELEDYDLIDRKVTQECPLQVKYTLTKKENALNSILSYMVEFSFQYELEKIFKDKKIK